MNKNNVSQTVQSVNHLLSQSRVALPSSHRYFADCLRENNARLIAWAMSRGEGKSWFATLTFKDYIRTNHARNLRNRWLARLGQAVFDINRGVERLRTVSATEWQLREVIHFHLIAMGKGIDSLSRKSWESRWESSSLFTGFCRIYDADEKAAPYLAKYTSKTLGGELEWGGDWQGLKSPASVNCDCSRRFFNNR
jgi:hypothetical protein